MSNYGDNFRGIFLVFNGHAIEPVKLQLLHKNTIKRRFLSCLVRMSPCFFLMLQSELAMYADMNFNVGHLSYTSFSSILNISFKLPINGKCSWHLCWTISRNIHRVCKLNTLSDTPPLKQFYFISSDNRVLKSSYPF